MKTKQVKKLLRKYTRWWIHWLGLGYWTVDIVFKKRKDRCPESDTVCGVCECDWKYLTAIITFYTEPMKNKTAYKIERAVVHELMHVFLHEMRWEGIEHEERVATQLQHAFTWVKGAHHA